GTKYGRGRAAPPETAETELVPSAPGTPVSAPPPAALAPAPPVAPAIPPAAPSPPVAPAAPPAAPAPAGPPVESAPPGTPAAPPATPAAPAPAAPAPAANRQRREYHSRSRCGERGSCRDGTPRAPPGAARAGSAPPDTVPSGATPPGSAPPVSAPPDSAPPISAPRAAPESTATSTGSAGSTWDTPEGAGPWGGGGGERQCGGERDGSTTPTRRTREAKKDTGNGTGGQLVRCSIADKSSRSPDTERERIANLPRPPQSGCGLRQGDTRLKVDLMRNVLNRERPQKMGSSRMDHGRTSDVHDHANAALSNPILLWGGRKRERLSDALQTTEGSQEVGGKLPALV
ncbi:unnamed protein product, partial [Closterium sp. NIES-54]